MAKRKLEVISFPETEAGKKEKTLYKSVDDLVDVMWELKEVGQITGRDGLPERVYVAFSCVLMDAIGVAKAESKEGMKPNHAMDT